MPATAPSAPKLTYHQKCVAGAYNAGRISCSNPLHFTLLNEPGQRWPKVVNVNPSRIIGMMVLRQEASCQCERDACSWAHKYQDRLGLDTDTFVLPGKPRRGVYKTDTPIKRVIQPAYIVNDFRYLQSQFPAHYFINSPFAHPHDHPNSHAITEILRRDMYDGLMRGTSECPKRYLDLHGNPSVANAYSKNNVGLVIETMVELITPRDHLRATKWPSDGGLIKGPITLLNPASLATYDGFLSIHTAYYYDDDFYAYLFHHVPRARLHMLMHRFDHDEGLINEELHYTKFERDGVIHVRQRQANGSDYYIHPDNKEWFESSCKPLTSQIGMAWTANQVCAGNWTFTVVACPAGSLVAPVKLTLTESSSTASMVEKGAVSCTVGGQLLTCPITPEQAPFFDAMRVWIAGQPRSNAKRKDFDARWKSLLSGPKKLYDVEFTIAFRLVNIAWCIDAGDQAATISFLQDALRRDTEILTSMNAPTPFLLDRIRSWPKSFSSSFVFSEPYRAIARSNFVPTHDPLPRYQEDVD